MRDEAGGFDFHGVISEVVGKFVVGIIGIM
jgi:hypothetical protein